MLVSSWALPVVEKHSLLDAHHVYDAPRLNRGSYSLKKKKKQAHLSWRKALCEIREMRYDVALDFYSLFRHNAGSLLSQANIAERVSFWPVRTPFFYTKHVFIENYQQHVLTLYKKFLLGWGVAEKHLENFGPVLTYKEPLQEKKLPFENYLILHVGTGVSKKKWSAASWRVLAQELHALGHNLIFTGKGKEEYQEIEQIKKGLAAAVNLCDQLHFRHLLECVKKATCVVGLDSLVGHLASAVETKALLIYGGSDNLTQWRPYNPCCEVITPSSALFVQGYAPERAIHTISPQDVLERIKRLL